MSKSSLKQKFILVGLGMIIVIMLPDWVRREAWKDIPSMAIVYALIFAIVLFTSFVEDYSKNQEAEAGAKFNKEMKKRLMAIKKKKDEKFNQ